MQELPHEQLLQVEPAREVATHMCCTTRTEDIELRDAAAYAKEKFHKGAGHYCGVLLQPDQFDNGQNMYELHIAPWGRTSA